MVIIKSSGNIGSSCISLKILPLQADVAEHVIVHNPIEAARLSLSPHAAKQKENGDLGTSREVKETSSFLPRRGRIRRHPRLPYRDSRCAVSGQPAWRPTRFLR
jgi:hypothetical protein